MSQNTFPVDLRNVCGRCGSSDLILVQGTDTVGCADCKALHSYEQTKYGEMLLPFTAGTGSQKTVEEKRQEGGNLYES